MIIEGDGFSGFHMTHGSGIVPGSNRSTPSCVSPFISWWFSSMNRVLQSGSGVAKGERAGC